MSRSIPAIESSKQFSGFPKLYQHYDLEKTHKATNYWAVPPKAKHPAVRAWLADPISFKDCLDAADRQWLGRNHARQREDQRERKLVDEGFELYRLIVRAHGRDHLVADKTYKRIRAKYLGPSRTFIEKWIQLCPTCCRHRK